MLCAAEPAMFQAVKGGWGAKGWTYLILKGADTKTALSALTMSYENVAPKAKPSGKSVVHSLPSPCGRAGVP